MTGNTIVKKYDYDEENNKIIYSDEFGNEIIYFIDDVWGSIYKVEHSDGTIINNNFDSEGKNILSNSIGNNSTSREIYFNYEGGMIKSLNNDNTLYRFSYTDGKLTSVQRNDDILEEHVLYKTRSMSYYPSLNNALYSNIINYDKYQRVANFDSYYNCLYDCDPKFDSITGNLITTINNGSANLAFFDDYIDNSKTRYSYERYDSLKSIEKTESNYLDKISKEDYEYNDYKQIKQITYNNAKLNQVFTSFIEYDNNKLSNDVVLDVSNRIKKYSYKINDSEASTLDYEYDNFKRLYNCNIKLFDHENTNIFNNRITYNNNRIWALIRSFNSSEFSRNAYTYDSQGRIITDVYTNGASPKINRYKYDIYGQLIREDNQLLNKTFVFYYDNNANLTSILKYNYTLSDTLTGIFTIDTFTYDSAHRTFLTNHNSDSILYDIDGKITEYKGNIYTWNRNLLTKISTKPGLNNSKNIVYNFTYNALGQRKSISYTRMDINSNIYPILGTEEKKYTKTFYYDNLNRLVLETKSSTLYDGTLTSSQLSYIYSGSSIIGLEYTSNNQINRYYFEKNIHNDVIGIYDNNGNCIVKYYYDAWGNCTIGSETTNYILANINPFRYRSYYYDVETNLFLVSSRYYSPELCRWISPDDVSYLDPSSVNGLNLYCYCFNDPVNYIDPDGHFPWLVLSIISGVLIVGGATLGGVSAYQSGRDVGTGILEGAFAAAMMVGSMWLMVGSFYVPNGLSSNLGLMMFTYGFNTMAGMTEAGATQIRYSISQGDHWSSNLTRSLAANAPSIYTTKAIPKMLPFATQFSWHIGEKYTYTIPGEGGVFYDYRTTKDAWGMFKNYLGKTPTLFSYGFAAHGIFQSSRGIYNSIWGNPNYNKWIVF